MPVREFSIDLDDNPVGIGSLIISDARLLVRPAVPGQYPASVRHDSGHAYRVLNLAHDYDSHVCHIVFDGTPEEARKLLDRVFYAYLDVCCMELWCDAEVMYFEQGDLAFTTHHGFTDGSYTLSYYVHCNVPEAQAEELIRALVTYGDSPQYFVARPNNTSARGYTVQAPVMVTHIADAVPIMREHANRIASYISDNSKIARQIELFGSLSRGDGNFNSDFDLIVNVDTMTAIRWLLAVRRAAASDSYDISAARIRRIFALKALGISEPDLEAATGIPVRMMDIFLFPVFWRKVAGLLQMIGRHDDPHFIGNIAADAVSFTPGRGFDFPARSAQ